MSALTSKTVLIIDDDWDLLDWMRYVLESNGYKILAASNGKEALDLLLCLPRTDLPHLILLDYQMPILDGYQFNEGRLRYSFLSSIPLVLMTSSTDLLPIIEQIDAEAYVSKPLMPENVLKLAQNFTYRRDVARVSFLA